MNECYIGDARDGLRSFIAAGIRAQTCITSPPYFGLRDYGTAQWDGGDAECDHKRKSGGGERGALLQGGDQRGRSEYAYAQDCGKCGATRIDRQIGIEPTIAEYVATMVDVFRLVREVLADDGTLWLNLEPCILAGTSDRGHCPACGKGWVRQWTHGAVTSTGGGPGREASGSCLIGNRGDSNVGKFIAREHITRGWQPGCACGIAETVPGIVLDPFMGSGTVGQVAQDLGRRWLGIELNPAYVAMQDRRTAQAGMVFA